MQGAGQMGNLANLGFGFGNQIADRQQSQGGMQQGMQQMLIDAAKGQFDGYTGAPIDALQTRMASTGAANMGQNTTTSKKNAGLFDYLSLGASFASDIRLKQNITPAGEVNGVQFYNWDWNDEGKRVAEPTQPTFGVIADELIKIHPKLVHRADDGYLRVDYTGLSKELADKE